MTENNTYDAEDIKDNANDKLDYSILEEDETIGEPPNGVSHDIVTNNHEEEQNIVNDQKIRPDLKFKLNSGSKKNIFTRIYDLNKYPFIKHIIFIGSSIIIFFGIIIFYINESGIRTEPEKEPSTAIALSPSDDLASSKKWYQTNPTTMVPTVNGNIEGFSSNDPLDRLIQPAEDGNPHAQYALGLKYDTGQGIDQDYEKARYWYEKAGNQSIAPAENNLGVMYAEGHGVDRDIWQAQQWFEEAALHNYAPSYTALGLIYSQGLGEAGQDYHKAFSYFQQAAQQNNVLAYNFLADMYYFGLGMPKDHVKARQWYEKAAAENNPKSQYALGLMMIHGDGGDKNDEEGEEFLKKACAGGVKKACSK